MELLEYGIVIVVEALAVFYVVHYFYRTFAESIRQNGCGGSCGCGKPVAKKFAGITAK